AEMVEPGAPAGAARIDVEPDIAVAHRDGAAGPRLGRRRHAEHRAVELLEYRVVLADDGDVVDLREHAVLPDGARRCSPDIVCSPSSSVPHRGTRAQAAYSTPGTQRFTRCI